ncbi:MAG: FAD-dependent oxidoreductase [Abditibacteriota bacterium]|nr:FAD-dependent oxidoreductase [Abditibacteriota bacterium]
MFDVIVAGGGLAGVSAAVAAAREGASVCLIEKNPYLGGLATGGLINPFMTHKTLDGKTKLVGGIFDEIKERLAEYDGIMTNCFDSEAMKRVLYDMVREENIDLFLEREILKVGYEIPLHSSSKTFVIETTGGSFEGDYVIDATGEGFVAYSYGCEYEGGDKGNTQAVTLMFTMEDVDCEKAIKYCIDHPEDFLFPKYSKFAQPKTIMKQAWSLAGFYSVIEAHRDEAKWPGDLLFFISLPKEGCVTFNQTHTSVIDSTDPAQLEEAYKECERQVYCVVDFVKKYIPGFENASLLKIADLLGVRESRRIMGKYVFNGLDVAYSKKQEDCICRLAYPVDVHKSSGEGYSKEEGEKSVPTPTKNDWYEIPYRSLQTQIPNLLVVGKCVSSTQEGHGAIRIMPACIATGQAAGVACGLSKKLGVNTDTLSGKILRETLRERGAIV